MKKNLLPALLAVLALLLCAGCDQGGVPDNPGGDAPSVTEIVVPGVPSDAEPSGGAEAVPDPVDLPEPAGAEQPDETPEPPAIPEPAETTVPEPAPADGGAASLMGADSAYLDAVRAYVLDNYGDWFDGEVILCSPLVYRVDATDPDDGKVWGNFWMTAYERDGNVMVMTGAGGPVGLVHLKASGDGYTVTAFEEAGDGAGFEADVRRICGGDEDLVNAFLSSTGADLLELRRAALRAYADENGLNITAFRDPDGTEVPLR